MVPPFAPKTAEWPKVAQDAFTKIRNIILEAAADAEVGDIEESLKWGEPAWRPKRARQGSTLRVAWSEKHPDKIGLFVNCKTTLAATMQEVYPKSFYYMDNRALYCDLNAELPSQAIDHLARLTFTYHRRS